VTVLFADLKGSLELLAGRDPEDARRLLDPVLERMMAAVHDYEGTVNQVMGDGIMALFGAPLAHEDHGVRACYAALRMQETVRAYAREAQRTEGIPVQIRVGLNSGEVVVRSIGSDLQMDYTAVGQTTHLAARMEQMALPGSILITGNTLRLAEGWVQVEPLGSVAVKGLPEPIEAYQLTGAGPARTRLEAAAPRGLTRFVGREAELRMLERALERAQAGTGQVVALVGEPGVGKSRIAREFSQPHRARRWLILATACVSYGRATPYLPIVELLKAYFQIETRDDERKVREKVMGRLLALDPGLESAVVPVLSLLGAAGQDTDWMALDPDQRRLQTLDAVKRLFTRESRAQPILVIVEDLHWIDTESQAVLDTIVEILPTARILLLVNYRPEWHHAWGSKTYCTGLEIDPLPAESSQALLRSLLGDAAGLEALGSILIERAQGNPFFLEESVRSLAECGVLAGERGAYRLDGDVGNVQVPATVQPILAARIDRLAPEDKRLLQTAAAIGKDVPFALLQAIADLPGDEVRLALGRLAAAEFLYERNLFPDLEYTFKHSLTHEVAYGSLLGERRRALHGRVVEAIEALHPARVAEQVDRLAHHAFHGELWERAVAYLQQAGARAAGRSAHREAATCFERALQALAHMPESRDRLESSLDLRLDLRRTLLPLGELTRIRHHLEEAEAIASALGDERRRGRVCAYLANHFWWVGDPVRALAAGERAREVATGLDDFTLRASTTFYLGQIHYARGAYARALDCFRQAVDSVGLPRNLDRVPGPATFFFGTWLVRCLAELGEFAEGVARAEEQAETAYAIGQPHSLLAADQALGVIRLRRGDFQQAIDVLDRPRAVQRQASLAPLYVETDMVLGYAHALAGRVDEGSTLLAGAAKQAEAMGMLVSQSQRVAWVGETALLAGRVDEADALARGALELARTHGEQGNEAWAHRLLGEIALTASAQPGSAVAQERYERALALGEQLGMRPLVAHCHLGLGKLYDHGRRREQAHEHLTAAATMYREMGMRFWLEPAEAQLEALR
jgi:class 3 adenylate cyclase/tetratricopeptide (TPR) repeat protein